MSRPALPRPIGATVLALSALIFLAAALPATGLAAPPPGSASPLVVSPAVNFARTTVGFQTGSWEISLLDEGEEEAAIENIYVDGENSGEFSYGGTDCTVLAQFQHCALFLQFQPGSVGEKHATAHIQFFGGRAEESFPVTGIGVPADFGFQPGGYDFGLQPVHSESISTTLQVRNDGEAGAQVNSLSFNGGNSNGLWFGNSDCYGRWLEPGESCSVEIDFGPNQTGPVATQLQASTGHESFSAEIKGEGGQPIVEASPDPVDFGAATVGADGATRTIVISNSGDVPAGFFIGIVAGGDSGSFQLLDENCTFAPLLPAGSCVAHIRFRPQGPGLKTAHLAFFGDGEGGTMVELSGEGVAPAVTLTPAGYDFGAQAAGTRSADHAFAVRNEGATSIELGSVAIVGTDLDQFPLAGDECTGATLAPGGECLVGVRFAPDGAGTRVAELRVGSDSGSFTAPLRGFGTDSGSPAQGQAEAGQAQTAPADPPPPRHHRHRRRFAHGTSLAAGSAQRPARAEPRGSVGPR
jgi:hypothetical protein